MHLFMKFIPSTEEKYIGIFFMLARNNEAKRDNPNVNYYYGDRK